MSSKKRFWLIASLMMVVCLVFAPLALADEVGLEEIPMLDPQTWKMNRDMTWDEQKMNPVVDWNTFDISQTATRDYKGLLILVDFKDRKFVVTQDPGSDLIGQHYPDGGNPQVNAPISREDVPEFYLEYLTGNTVENHGVNTQGHWAEITNGQWNVTLDAVGVYEMPGLAVQYSHRMANAEDRPAGLPRLSGNVTGVHAHALQAAEADGVDLSGYDFGFVLYAGYDESGTWQEFGEMIFETKYDIPRDWGAQAYFERQLGDDWEDELPAETVAWAKEREEQGIYWASTRYGDDPWTPWYNGTGIWAHATNTTISGRTIRISVQGENDGMGTFSHELGHILGLTDNYTDQFATPYERTHVGQWDIMGTGNFAGVGGNHARWKVPSYDGASVPSLMGVRTKWYSNFYVEDQIIEVTVDELKAQTPLVAEITSRNIPIGDVWGTSGRISGIRIHGMVDQAPVVPYSEDWKTETNIVSRNGTPFDGYTVEVIDRSGYDTLMNDHGVMLSKTKDREQRINTWVIDAHPEDLAIIDFYRPESGDPVVFPKGHIYQLDDALFHAGISEVDHYIGSGDTVNEYVTDYNRLHFYILDKIETDAQYGEILSYQVAVRHMDGPAVDGELVLEEFAVEEASPGRVAEKAFKVTNTGTATDIVRVSIESTSSWNIALSNNIYAIDPGETAVIPVYFEIPADAQIGTTDVDLTITVASESNPDKVATLALKDIGDEVLFGADVQVQPLAAITAPAEVLLDGSREIHYVVTVDDIQRAGAFVLEGTFDYNRLDYLGTEINLAGKHDAYAYQLATAYDDTDGSYWLPIVLRGEDFRTHEEAALVTVKFKVKDSFGDESLNWIVEGKLNLMEVTLLDADRHATEVLAQITKGSVDTIISKKGLKYDINGDKVFTMADIVMIMDRFYKVNENDAAWTAAVTYDIVADGEINTGDLVAFLDLLYK